MMYGSYLVTVWRFVSLSSLISVDVSVLTYVSIAANAINGSSNLFQVISRRKRFSYRALFFS